MKEYDAETNMNLYIFLDVDPLLTKTLDVALQPPPRLIVDRLVRMYPLGPLAEDVVVRYRDEVVAVGLVPVEHHLGVVVTIRPQGVGMEVAFPPARGLGLGSQN